MSDPSNRTFISLFNHEEISIPNGLRILDDSASTVPSGNKSLWCILTEEDGDIKIEWDAGNPDEVKQAKVLYDSMLAEGLEGIYVRKDGSPSSNKMLEFDGEANQAIFGKNQLVSGG